MNQLLKIKQKILAAKSVLILGHRDADGDALGSMIMFNSLVKKLKPKAQRTLALCQEYKNELQYFIDKYKIHTALSAKKYDLIIALDTSTAERLPFKVKADINIDHHADNEKYAEINIVDPTAASAGLIVLELFKKYGLTLDKPAAEGLYLSIYTDTGKFSFANTDARVFRAATLCLEQGITPHQIYKIVYEQKKLTDIQEFGKCLAGVETFFNGQMIVGYIYKKDKLDNRTLVDYIRQEKHARLAIVMVEKKDHVKLSFRSKDGMDVSRIARALNGGGHPFAAAGKIFAKNIPAAKKVLLKYFQENVF